MSPSNLSRRVLNAGSGPHSPRALHGFFADGSWEEVRLDIDPGVKPDVVGSIIDMKAVFTDSSFDAVWSSHNLEHLYAHEVRPALGEFRRILKQDGFALITTPDLETVARFIVEQGLEASAYTSPAGPITALDMLYGHSASIERGNVFMSHNTGYTSERLGNLLLDADFAEAIVRPGAGFDLWAIAFMPHTDRSWLLNQFKAYGVDFSE
jgi:hypothetical protein